jgi:hypothetical protein
MYITCRACKTCPRLLYYVQLVGLRISEKVYPNLAVHSPFSVASVHFKASGSATQLPKLAGRTGQSLEAKLLLSAGALNVAVRLL